MIATFLQALGLALVAVGAFLVWPWLGFVAAGVGCVLLGLALER